MFFYLFQEAIARLESWLHLWELWQMRVVAIDTVVLRAGATSTIPIPIHSSVGSMFVLFHLRPMTLGTQSHYFGEFNPTTVSQLERVVIFRVVARQAANSSVGKLQRAVKFV